ncbi:glutathione peroxidase [Olivibacter sp. SDN3]|uniref:glutathione peroxidase n=1 Tax=Olivibacter sp. SDN3 TaxID=2764720 RepID=UPI001650EDAE|nr:glutathione peroxidase [Olivibacter sp. SDN3]QNL50096.1 glutathione peroxidase [Olivibacter sp. SDN3]
MKTTMLIFTLLFAISQEGDIYKFNLTSIDGDTISLSQFKGKKILLVNTASKCGFTPQYKELEELSKKFKDKLVIIGFPANNFGDQEPGSNDDIKSFCEQNYGVTFLLSEKTDVKGDDIDPLFAYLTQEENPDFTGEIKWNFEKFLIDEKGKLIHRYRSAVSPLSKDITAQL